VKWWKILSECLWKRWEEGHLASLCKFSLEFCRDTGREIEFSSVHTRVSGMYLTAIPCESLPDFLRRSGMGSALTFRLTINWWPSLAQKEVLVELTDELAGERLIKLWLGRRSFCILLGSLEIIIYFGNAASHFNFYN
jgi:hypothetical protein